MIVRIKYIVGTILTLHLTHKNEYFQVSIVEKLPNFYFDKHELLNVLFKT